MKILVLRKFHAESPYRFSVLNLINGLAERGHAIMTLRDSASHWIISDEKRSIIIGNFIAILLAAIALVFGTIFYGFVLMLEDETWLRGAFYVALWPGLGAIGVAQYYMPERWWLRRLFTPLAKTLVWAINARQDKALREIDARNTESADVGYGGADAEASWKAAAEMRAIHVIAPSDDAWLQVVRELAARADVVCMNMTETSDALDQEIEVMRGLPSSTALVFLTPDPEMIRGARAEPGRKIRVARTDGAATEFHDVVEVRYAERFRNMDMDVDQTEELAELERILAAQLR